MPAGFFRAGDDGQFLFLSDRFDGRGQRIPYATVGHDGLRV